MYKLNKQNALNNSTTKIFSLRFLIALCSLVSQVLLLTAGSCLVIPGFGLTLRVPAHEIRTLRLLQRLCLNKDIRRNKGRV